MSTTTPSQLKNEMLAINNHPSADVMLLPQTKNAFLQLFGEKHGEIQLMKETTYFNEMLAGVNGEKIKQCSAISVQSALLTILGSGLSLSPVLQEATILPRYNSKTNVTSASVSIMYSGKIKMMTNSKVISHIKWNEVVWDCDTLTCTNGVFDYKKNFIKPSTSKRIGVLLIAVLPNKQERHVFLDAEELEKRKKISKNSSMWESWTDQMWRKTAIHELFKYLPKTKEVAELKELFEQEDIVEGENTYNEANDSHIPVSEVLEPEVKPKQEEVQDEILLETLRDLIEEHGSQVLSADQIEKTKQGLPTFSNEKLTKLITSMNDKIASINASDDSEKGNEPPF